MPSAALQTSSFPALMHTRAVRWLLAAVGSAFVALGIIGIALPGMPTTVFLILASLCYAKSCPKLDAWLMEHPRLGVYLRAFRRGEPAPPGTRQRAIAVLWTALLLSAAMLTVQHGGPSWWLAALALVGIGVSIIILTTIRTAAPTHAPTPAH